MAKLTYQVPGFKHQHILAAYFMQAIILLADLHASWLELLPACQGRGYMVYHVHEWLRTPEAQGLLVYISGKPLIPMVYKIYISRLTIVSHEAKKKQAVRDD